MINIRKWAKNKPEFPAFVSIQLALAVPFSYGIRKLIKKGSVLAQNLDESDLSNWPKLYRRHRKFNSLIVNLRNLALPFNLKKNGDDLIEVNNNEIQLNKNFKDNLRYLTEITFFSTKEIIEPSEENKKNFVLQNITEELFIKNDMLKNLEFVFLLSVWFPCFLEYFEHPVKLIRKARLGNMEALEKVLWLDKLVTNDPKIDIQFKRASQNIKIARFKRLTKAHKSTSPGKLSRKRMKISMAGIISVTSEILRHRFNAEEIRKLFDAVSKDLGISRIDTDLPKSPESLSKAIWRERPLWQPLSFVKE